MLFFKATLPECLRNNHPLLFKEAKIETNILQKYRVALFALFFICTRVHQILNRSPELPLPNFKKT
jgi:hypothetical protein